MDNSEIQTLINRIPLPIARPYARLLRASKGRDLYETSLTCFEVLLKYLSCVLIASLKQYSPDAAYELEYKITRATSLGEWGNSLRTATKALAEVTTPDWIFSIQRWLTGKQAFQELSPVVIAGCQELYEGLKRDGDEGGQKLNDIISIFEFLIYLRNKTKGHGAKPEAFYQRHCETLKQVVLGLATDCPALKVKLAYRTISRFDECSWLMGLTPIGRESVPSNLPQSEDSTLFVVPANEVSLYLPPLLQYEEGDDMVWLLNGEYNTATQKIEYIDYTLGKVMRQAMPKYSREPIPQRSKIRGVIKFETSGESELVGVTQCHRPSLLGKARDKIPNGVWRKCEFSAIHAARVPAAGGLYCLVSHPVLGGFDEYKVVGYVGKATNLQNRFNDYINEKYDEDGRQSVRDFLSNFPNIYFHYTLVEDEADQKNLEDWLIKAIDPPANSQLKFRDSSKLN